MNNAFVYCWTDADTGKLYVGSHKGTLEDGYICSSKLMMQHYNERPETFTRQIIAEGTYEDIRVLESKILKSTNAAFDEHYYNKHNGDGKFYNKGFICSEETKKKISLSLKGRISPMKGRKMSAETLIKMSTSRKGSKNPMFGKIGANKGKSFSIETKRKMSEATKGKTEGKREASIKGWITRKNNLNVI